MVNNDVLKKLRVALKLRDEDIVEILKLVDFKITKSELGAFFRKEDHPNYVECGDQILRNFLNGLVLQYRGTKDNPKGEDALPKKAKQKAKTPFKPRPAKTGGSKPFSFKDQQRKRADTDLSPVKYKNKKK